jgi:hypothetical protein
MTILKFKKIEYILENRLSKFFNQPFKIKIQNAINNLPKKNKLLIKKLFKTDKRINKNQTLKEIVLLSVLCLHFKKVNLLCDFLSEELQKAKRPG